MDRYSELKRKLKMREMVSMSNVSIMTSPFLIDAMDNVDCIQLDKEHGLYGTEELVPLTMRCREKKIPSIVRVEDSVYHLIAKAMDLGADGIMLPRTESIEQLKVAVESMYLPPIGRAGCGGWGLFRDGEDFQQYQNSRVLMPQIESPRGIEKMPEMIDAFGEYIDAFIIGPSDLSIRLGCPGEWDHPNALDSIQKVFDISKKAGISCGCYSLDPAHLEKYKQMGANVAWFGNEISYIRMGIERYMEIMRN